MNTEKKTSSEWYKNVPEKYELHILNYDGWGDRSHFDYSFNKELITKKEFIQKVINSTISCKFLTHFINEW